MVNPASNDIVFTKSDSKKAKAIKNAQAKLSESSENTEYTHVLICIQGLFLLQANSDSDVHNITFIEFFDSFEDYCVLRFPSQQNLSQNNNLPLATNFHGQDYDSWRELYARFIKNKAIHSSQVCSTVVAHILVELELLSCVAPTNITPSQLCTMLIQHGWKDVSTDYASYHEYLVRRGPNELMDDNIKYLMTVPFQHKDMYSALEGLFAEQQKLYLMQVDALEKTGANPHEVAKVRSKIQQMPDGKEVEQYFRSRTKRFPSWQV